MLVLIPFPKWPHCFYHIVKLLIWNQPLLPWLLSASVLLLYNQHELEPYKRYPGCPYFAKVSQVEEFRLGLSVVDGDSHPPILPNQGSQLFNYQKVLELWVSQKADMLKLPRGRFAEESQRIHGAVGIIYEEHF